MKKAYNKNRGFGLVEGLIAVAILGFVVVGIMKYMYSTVEMLVKSRENIYAAKLTKQTFSYLNNIPYFYVFDCDSSQPDFGLSGTFGPVTAQSGTYPYLSVLNEIRSSVKETGFEKFTVTTSYLIRDTSDLNGDGKTTDLREFEDLNSDNADDYDSAIRYYDQNSDGDYNDFYGSPEISEQPNTHMKEVTITLYKKGKDVFEESQLISLEKMTGTPGDTGGAELKLLLSTPTQDCALYALDTAERQASFNLSITKPYPSSMKAFRADAVVPLYISGETDPASSLDFRLHNATSPIQDTGTSDILGDFSIGAINITSSLQEGGNTIWGQATKGTHYAAWTKRDIVRDINPPEIQDETPSGAVSTKQPFVSAYLVDEPAVAGNEPSGICEDIIGLYCNGAEVNMEYDSSSGLISWIDPSTSLPMVLSTGTLYTIVLEGGDNAFYKAKSTWTFTCSVPDTDNSAPTVSEKSPSGMAGSNPPTISCKVHDNQSGIIISSIRMELDGYEVVSSSNISQYFTPLPHPEGGYVTYAPGSPLTSGPHNVLVIVSHWADNPYNKKTTTETWSFHVP